MLMVDDDRAAASARTAAFLQSIANTLADAVERRTAEEIEELSAARGRLVAQTLDAEERARRRISETLHDGALQDVLAAGHDLYALSGHGGTTRRSRRRRTTWRRSSAGCGRS